MESIVSIADQIRQRTATESFGIGLAGEYVKQVQSSSCDTRGDSWSWKNALKEADEQLVYGADEMRVCEHHRATGGDGAPENCALVFEAVITTTRLDRDGDVLESSGARPDPEMPLLWQHIPLEPIGKLLSVERHDQRLVTGRFAIIDSALGRDAAALVEFGALRVSHGFLPLEFEPLKDSDGGWHIKTFEIVEASLVSVPSNTEAVITAFSRQKLHHPWVKHWAQGLIGHRSPTVRVGFDADQSAQLQSVRADLQDLMRHVPATRAARALARSALVQLNEMIPADDSSQSEKRDD